MLATEVQARRVPVDNQPTRMWVHVNLGRPAKKGPHVHSPVSAPRKCPSECESTRKSPSKTKFSRPIARESSALPADLPADTNAPSCASRISQQPICLP